MKPKKRSSSRILNASPMAKSAKPDAKPVSKIDIKLRPKRMSTLIKKNSNEVIDRHVAEESKVEDSALPRFLHTSNPNVSKVLVSHNPGSRKLERNEMISQLVMHFSVDSLLMIKDSDEHKRQEELLEDRSRDIKEVLKTHEIWQDNGYGSSVLEPSHVREAQSIIRNKFNYSETAIQTKERIIKERGVSTANPLLFNFTGEVDQSMIYEAYMAHVRATIPDRLKELKMPVEKSDPSDGKSLYSSSFRRCLKVVERMIIQNDNQERFHDYRYLFTEADSGTRRGVDKSICPLWRFAHAPAKSLSVTSIVWNPKYADLFATSYGSYDFGKRVKGNTICLFSVKNSTYPEAVIPTEDAVMCLEFNPSAPAMLAAGLANGNVLVFDVRSAKKEPVHRSNAGDRKHSDIVWQIKWSRVEDASQKQSFYSVSADGRVLCWTLMKDKLDCQEVFKLRFIDRKRKGKEGEEPSLTALSAGLTIDFCPADRFSFIVGTEDGAIHRCSSTYSGEYQFSYEGHSLAVYKVRFHPFEKETFLSASADWTVKVWNLNNKAPLMIFDQKQAIVDAMWSPFNSCVFVALATDRLSIFNLNKKRHEEDSHVSLIKNGKCTNLAFNMKEPILLVGDSLGGTMSLKFGRELGKLPIPVGQEEAAYQLATIQKCIELGSMTN